MMGYVVGCSVVLILITVVGTLGGIGFHASLGIGAFVGAWGGGGFGFMVGATLALDRQLNDAKSVHSNRHGREAGEV